MTTKLEALRIERGLSREKLSRLLGMSLCGVRLMCVQGRLDAPYSTVKKISETMGVSIEAAADLLLPIEGECEPGKPGRPAIGAVENEN